MNQFCRRLLLLVFSAIGWGILVSIGWGDDQGGSRPNILFIVADDLGWGDLHCYGNPHLDTPALDGLASQGVRLTSYYTPSSLCAPARAGLLTGRFNHRTGAVDVPSNRGLDRLAGSEMTFGDFFRHAGYRTAVIGKWHNGAYCRDQLPHHRGFDRFFGFPNGGQDYWKWNLLSNDQPVPHDGRYLSDVLNEEAIHFIQDRGEQPFAMVLAHHAPHSPLQAPEALIAKYRQRLGGDASPAVVVTYAMIEAMDLGLERVFDTLKKEGIWRQTVIVFTSDNGPVLRRDPKLGSQLRFNGGFSGEKESMLEGGIRVPAIVAWPSHFPAGRVIDLPIHGCDWLPTLFDLAKSPRPAKAKPWDGLNILPLLLGNSMPTLTERMLFFQRNRYAPARHVNAAVRQGRWKLYWAGSESAMKKDSGRDNPSYLRGLVHPHWEMPLDRQLDAAKTGEQSPARLYDLQEDPAEQRDMAADKPELVKSLIERHDQWFDEMVTEWTLAREKILADDREYWKGRVAPDPLPLFQDFWQWKQAAEGTDPVTADPLKVFQGYWSHD